MKYDFVIICVLVIISCAIFVGCIDKRIDDTDITTEETHEVIEYPEIHWPSYGMSTLVPRPDWATNGEIEYNDNAFSANISGVSKRHFNEYVESCIDAGFDDIRTDNGTEFCAFNDDEVSIYLKYKEGYILHIWIG